MVRGGGPAGFEKGGPSVSICSIEMPIWASFVSMMDIVSCVIYGLVKSVYVPYVAYRPFSQVSDPLSCSWFRAEKSWI